MRFESIAEHCERTKNNKLLIDTTELDVKILSRVDTSREKEQRFSRAMG